MTLNSSGDPVEAAEILDTAESHIVALTHIVERVPEIVSALQAKLPDQLEDLESGYRKLLESGYHFTETDIESRFQQLHASLKNNMANVSALELDNAIYENEQIQEEIDALMRNEIYARHGYVFNTNPFKAYFNSKSWYHPDSSFKGDDSELNDYEIKNVQTIKSVENSK